MEKLTPKEKESLANNKKLALMDNWKVTKEKFSDAEGIVLENKEGYYLRLEEINYDESWDLLIPLYAKICDTNQHYIFSDLAPMNTNFLLGVRCNNIQQSFNAIIMMINHHNFKSPYIPF